MNFLHRSKSWVFTLYRVHCAWRTPMHSVARSLSSSSVKASPSKSQSHRPTKPNPDRMNELGVSVRYLWENLRLGVSDGTTSEEIVKQFILPRVTHAKSESKADIFPNTVPFSEFLRMDPATAR